MLDVIEKEEISNSTFVGFENNDVNLLKYIKNDENHPFNFIQFADNFTSIITFNNIKRQVYTNKKSYLEVLSREIFVNTYLKDEKNYYIEEYTEAEGFRADLVTRLLDQNPSKQNIIEFKVLDSNTPAASFQTEVESAFSQVKNKYITAQDGDLFVSIVVMDLQKIVESPNNLEKFMTLQDSEKHKTIFVKNKANHLFKKYGISIITKKYNKNTSNYAGENWFHIPKHCKIEIDRNNLDSFNQAQIVAEIQDAIHFPTASSTYGIKNVRDIKDPEKEEEKKNLLLEIFNTTLEAYKNKDASLINRYGKEKDFVFIKEHSIIKNVNFKNVEYYSLTTMSGAIIDGQNSIDCFKLILDFVTDKLTAKVIGMPKYYEKMDKLLHTVLGSLNNGDFAKLKAFIQRMKITIRLTETDSEKEATKIAINKNNTMVVTQNELVVSKFGDCVQVISNEMLQEHNLLIGYPKKTNYGVSKKDKENNMIHCEELAKITNVVLEINNEGFNASQLFSYKSKLVKKTATKPLEEFCKNFSEDIIDESSDEVKQIEKKMLETKEEIKTAKTELACYQKMAQDALSETAQEEIENKQKLYKEYEKQRSLALTSSVRAKNLPMLANIHQTVILIKKVLKNINKYIPGDVLKKINIAKDYTMFCYCFLLLLRKYKNHNFNKKVIKEADIEIVVTNFFNNYYNFVNNYPNINITGLNHTTADAKTTNSEGVEVSLSDIINELCKV